MARCVWKPGNPQRSDHRCVVKEPLEVFWRYRSRCNLHVGQSNSFRMNISIPHTNLWPSASVLHRSRGRLINSGIKVFRSFQSADTAGMWNARQHVANAAKVPSYFPLSFMRSHIRIMISGTAKQRCICARFSQRNNAWSGGIPGVYALATRESPWLGTALKTLNVGSKRHCGENGKMPVYAIGPCRTGRVAALFDSGHIRGRHRIAVTVPKLWTHRYFGSWSRPTNPLEHAGQRILGYVNE